MVGTTVREGLVSRTVAALVGDQGLGGEEGAGAGEADEERPLQLLGHEVGWVLPFHVALLELGIGEGDEAAGALRAPRWPEGRGERAGEASKSPGLLPPPASCQQ